MTPLSEQLRAKAAELRSGVAVIDGTTTFPETLELLADALDENAALEASLASRDAEVAAAMQETTLLRVSVSTAIGLDLIDGNVRPDDKAIAAACVSLRAEVARLREALQRMDCTCLPYAEELPELKCARCVALDAQTEEKR